MTGVQTCALPIWRMGREEDRQICSLEDLTGHRIRERDFSGRNQTLSEKRAKSVYDYLMMQGVSTDRMVYEGKGIHDPVASNDTPEGRSLNRRVEIVILANQKMIQEAQQGTLR